MGHIKSRGWMRLLPFLAVLGSFALPHLAHAQSQYQTCAFSDPTHCYGIGPGTAGQAYVSNGQAYPSFSSSLPGVTSVGGVTIPATASVFLTGPTTTTATLCFLSTTTAGLGSWGSCSGGSGGVSTVSVVSANGLSGTVANPTTTPAITLAPTFTGWAYSNGSGFAAATLTGDCSFTLEAITCLDSNGVPIVTTTGTQTLTNKSISGSEINSGTVGTTYGGTGLATYAAGDLLYAPSTNTLSALAPTTNGYVLTLVSGLPAWAPSSGGSMTWPSAAGIPNYSGSESWGTSYSASNTIPADFISTLNQNTTGTAANVSGTPALPNGTTATTQTTGDNTTKLATDAFVLANAASAGVSSVAAGSGIAVTGTGSGPYTGAITVSTTVPSRTAASPTVASTDMGGIIYVSSGTITIPAISSTVLAAGMSVQLTNYSGSAEGISTTPTVNSGGGCVSGTGIPAGDTWYLSSNGTTLDCAQTISAENWLNAASSGASVTPICNPGMRLTVTTVTATGNLTINAPTGCTEGQQVIVKITYSASITYTWNSAYHANAANPGAVPTSSGATSGVDFFTFYDDASNTRFDYLAGAQAF